MLNLKNLGARIRTLRVIYAKYGVGALKGVFASKPKNVFNVVGEESYTRTTSHLSWLQAVASKIGIPISPDYLKGSSNRSATAAIKQKAKEKQKKEQKRVKRGN